MSWASPSGSAASGGGTEDSYWRRPAPGDGAPAPVPPDGPPVYEKPPPMVPSSSQVGWGPLITPGPTPRALPPQDHDALDEQDARARNVTVGVGVAALIVLFLLLLMLVIRAGTDGSNL